LINRPRASVPQVELVEVDSTAARPMLRAGAASFAPAFAFTLGDDDVHKRGRDGQCLSCIVECDEEEEAFSES
jgi:hypothetical protein